MRTHRQLKQLAVNLSRQGIHVMRFDYPGCGDSGGSWEDCTVNDWVNSIVTAAGELEALSQGSKITFLGVRLGATLLQEAPLDDYQNSLRIWLDPILDGAAYWEKLRKLQSEILNDNNRFVLPRHDYLHSHERECQGCTVSESTLEQLKKLKLRDPANFTNKFLLLYSHQEEAYRKFTENDEQIELRKLAMPCNWDELSANQEQVIIPELTKVLDKFIK